MVESDPELGTRLLEVKEWLDLARGHVAVAAATVLRGEEVGSSVESEVADAVFLVCEASEGLAGVLRDVYEKELRGSDG